MYDQLSEWVSKGIPTFFYTDFKGEKLIASPIDRLHQLDIEFSFDSARSSENSPHTPLNFPLPYSDYKKKFSSVQEHIRCGNSYLLNLTQPTPIETPYSLRQIYAMAHAPYKIRVANHFVSFSPEPFITIQNNTIHTYPMKGTIDASLPDAVKTIMNDPKEIAEHTMIVDLLRNDIGMVATNVKVKKFRYITTINTGEKKLHQVSSHISGDMEGRWRENFGEVLRKLLPAGSISGTPKKKTVEIIETIEEYERGFFSGVFGYFDGESVYSAVAIRYIENTDGKLLYKSGGGITADSDSEKEYQEMIDKIYIP